MRTAESRPRRRPRRRARRARPGAPPARARHAAQSRQVRLESPPARRVDVVVEIANEHVPCHTSICPCISLSHRARSLRPARPAPAAARSGPDTDASSPCSTDSPRDPRFPETSARGIPSARSPCAAPPGSSAIARSTAREILARARDPRSTPTARPPRPARSGRCLRAAGRPAARRSRRIQSRHRFSAMRYSHDENLAWPSKPGQRAERAEKRLLAHVARVLFAADGAVREGIDRPLPSQDELVEAVDVAPRSSGRRALRRSTSWPSSSVLVDLDAPTRVWPAVGSHCTHLGNARVECGSPP